MTKHFYDWAEIPVCSGYGGIRRITRPGGITMKLDKLEFEFVIYEMFYRRKLLLGVIEEFGGTLSHTKLQKILFLTTRKQENKSFDFVPYKFGSFSFLANQDLKTLTKKGLISDTTSKNMSSWTLLGDEGYFRHLKKEDQAAIKETKREVRNFNQRELVKYTYLNFPYWAIKSQIANELLSRDELLRINSQKRQFNEPAFFTIGYEGISLETYLNKLITNDVRLLCDVRKNPISMKYGFSKSQLKKACESIDISYLHIPELGIDSEKRSGLKTTKDYQNLFDDYERTTLIDNVDQLEKIFDLANEYKRIAITCFEKEPCMCHRSRVANSLRKLPKWDMDQKNL